MKLEGAQAGMSVPADKTAVVPEAFPKQARARAVEAPVAILKQGRARAVAKPEDPAPAVPAATRA
jgi:hypothetical protein